MSDQSVQQAIEYFEDFYKNCKVEKLPVTLDHATVLICEVQRLRKIEQSNERKDNGSCKSFRR